MTKVTLLVFTISGALSGLAGIMYASRWGFVNPSNTGSGFEFQVIAAVVIGGVSINGGVGTVLGAVLGVLLLGCVAAALPLLGIAGTTQNAIYGAVILVALLIDRLVRLQGRRGAARPGGGMSPVGSGAVRDRARRGDARARRGRSSSSARKR